MECQKSSRTHLLPTVLRTVDRPPRHTFSGERWCHHLTSGTNSESFHSFFGEPFRGTFHTPAVAVSRKPYFIDAHPETTSYVKFNTVPLESPASVTFTLRSLAASAARTHLLVRPHSFLRGLAQIDEKSAALLAPRYAYFVMCTLPGNLVLGARGTAFSGLSRRSQHARRTGWRER